METDFTEEELYVIERDADLNAGIAGKNIHKIAEQLLIMKATDKVEKRILTEYFKLFDEHARSAEIYKTIRDKCEAMRGERR